MADTQAKPPVPGHVEAAYPHVNVHDTYAVGSDNEPITVLGTMGQDPDAKQTVPWTAWIIVFFCGIAMIQNTYIGIAPAANAYTIAGALNGNDKRVWIVQAQAVPSIVTGPIFAIISDVYGRRWIVNGAYLLFVVSSIIAMTAHSINVVILSQAITGFAAGISGIIFAVTSEVVPGIYRTHVQTWLTVVGIIGALLALLAAGAASNADHVDGWRWIYRMNLIINALLLFGFGFFYKPPPRTVTKGTLIEKMKTLDWIGYFLLIAGLVPLLMGLAWSSDSNYGWSSKHSYVPVAVGCAMFIACLVYEWKGTSRGFLDHRLFQNGRNFPIACVIIAVEGSLFYLINNIYAAEANGLWDTPGTLRASARLLPFFVTVTILGPFMSLYVTKRKDIKWPLAAGFSFFAVAIIGLALARTNGTLGLVFNAIGGIGFCAPLILVMTLVQYSTPPLFIGIASALTISARTLGGSVSLAIADAIYASKTTDQVPAAIAGAVIPLGFKPQYLGQLIGFLFSGQGLDAIPGITPQILGAASAAMKKTQAHGYEIAWFAFLPGTIIAAILCVFLKNPSERMNWVTDAPLKDLPHETTTHETHNEASQVAANEIEK